MTNQEQRECWSNLTLAALRLAWASRRDPLDQPAALGMIVDSDGMVKPGPLTVEDVVILASRAMRGDDDGLIAA